ncbi:steryl acetyl hydrolase [Babesia caballi]|uniref:Steryl acetyl hydrolase n=1 Tax=Babesia caballi TaxID=5871 RepID=A0AAV4LW06_BABCB|nr:steryl acetyl hydrolase [Babesia caballi]
MPDGGENEPASRERSAAKITEVSQKATESDNGTKGDGGSWLSRLLGRLDARKKVDPQPAHQEPPEEALSSDSEETETEELEKAQRKRLSYRELLLTDLSEVSSLIKKSNFCQMEVGEDNWQEYRTFMYRSYRSQVNKVKRLAEDKADPPTGGNVA